MTQPWRALPLCSLLSHNAGKVRRMPEILGSSTGPVDAMCDLAEEDTQLKKNQSANYCERKSNRLSDSPWLASYWSDCSHSGHEMAPAHDICHNY